ALLDRGRAAAGSYSSGPPSSFCRSCGRPGRDQSAGLGHPDTQEQVRRSVSACDTIVLLSRSPVCALQTILHLRLKKKNFGVRMFLEIFGLFQVVRVVIVERS